jgi:hypothetical protein
VRVPLSSTVAGCRAIDQASVRVIGVGKIGRAEGPAADQARPVPRDAVAALVGHLPVVVVIVVARGPSVIDRSELVEAGPAVGARSSRRSGWRRRRDRRGRADDSCQELPFVGYEHLPGHEGRRR